jgi:hypothetical protein
VDARDDRTKTPISTSTSDGRGVAARPLPSVGPTRPAAFAGGPAAREFPPMDLKTFQRSSELETRRPTDRRSRNQESVAMYEMHPNLMHTAAVLRMQDLQAEAARRRMLRQARADRATVRPLTALRRAVGTTLVRAGERVQGVERAAAAARPSAGDLAVTGTHLRLVR